MEIILLGIKIFSARILDVSLGTIRMILTVKGKNLSASIMGFCEVLIWFIIVKEALNTNETSLLIPISYALGFSSGTYIGSYLSDKFISGTLTVQIITSMKDKKLIKIIKKNGFGVSVIEVNKYLGGERKYLLIIEIDKKRLNKLKTLVKKLDKNCFITVDETKAVYNGYFK